MYIRQVSLRAAFPGIVLWPAAAAAPAYAAAASAAIREFAD